MIAYFYKFCDDTLIILNRINIDCSSVEEILTRFLKSPSGTLLKDVYFKTLALLRCRLRLGGQVAHYDVHNISTLATLLRLTDASDQIHFSEYVCYLLKIIRKMLDFSHCLTCTTRELRLVRFAQLCQFLRIQYLFNPFNPVRKEPIKVADTKCVFLLAAR